MWKEGDRIRIIDREETSSDKESRKYYKHMSGLVGTIQNIYTNDEIAVKVDVDCLEGIVQDVHQKSQDRMRKKFLSSISEEQKSKLVHEEKKFNAHYVLLVDKNDLERI